MKTLPETSNSSLPLGLCFRPILRGKKRLRNLFSVQAVPSCLSKGNEIPKHLVKSNTHQAKHSVKVAKQRLILFYATGMKAV